MICINIMAELKHTIKDPEVLAQLIKSGKHLSISELRSAIKIATNAPRKISDVSVSIDTPDSLPDTPVATQSTTLNKPLTPRRQGLSINSSNKSLDPELRFSGFTDYEPYNDKQTKRESIASLLSIDSTSTNVDPVFSPSETTKINDMYQNISMVIRDINNNHQLLHTGVKSLNNKFISAYNELDALRTDILKHKSIVQQVHNKMEKLAQQDLVKQLQEELYALHKKCHMLSNIQKQITDIRISIINLFNKEKNKIQQYQDNVSLVKASLMDEVKLLIKKEVAKQLQESAILDKRINELTKKERTSITQQVRKSTIQLKEQLTEYVDGLIE